MTSELSPDDEELLAELLLDWEDSLNSPPPKTPEELCQQRMDLVDELKRRIAMLHTMNRLMISPTAVTRFDPGGTPESFVISDFPQIPGYEIVEDIGRGGMGIVYKATQLSVKRFVAIKVINSVGQNQAGLIDRLRREADALGRLNHEHVIRVHDVIDRGGLVCLVLEYVDGRNLDQRESASAIDPRSAAEIALTVATTMADVHRTGMLHRDLKPANLLRDKQGNVKISDFGLAKHLGNESSSTVTGERIGTPSFMAPEQAFGISAEIGVWTDVYAIGATLYDLITGRPPFVGTTVLATLSQLKELEPVSPRLLVPGIPRDLETICLKCLAKEPSRRYPSAASLAADLQKFLEGKSISARPANSLELGWRWTKRNPDRAGWIAAIVLGLITAMGLGAWELTRIHYAATLAKSQADALEAERQNGRVQEFYRSLGKIRERSLRRPTGWSWANREQLKQIAPLRPANDQNALYQLRSEVTNALAAFDARKQRELLHGFDPYAIEFRPDGTVLVAGANADDDEGIKLAFLDTTTWEVIYTLNFPVDEEWVKHRPDGVRSMLFSPDGKELYVGCRSGWIRVFDLTLRTEVRQWRAHNHYIFRLRFTSDGKSLLSCSKDQSLKKWSLNGQKLAEVPHNSELKDLVVLNDDISPTTPHIAVAGDPPLWLRESDFQQAESTGNAGEHLKQGYEFAARYPDGGGWIRDSGSGFEALSSYNQRSLQRLIDPKDKFRRIGEMHGIEISPDGRWLITTKSDSAKLWDLAAGRREVELQTASRGRVVGRFHPHQSQLVLTGDTKLTIYELTPESIWENRVKQASKIYRSALSPDGQCIAAVRGIYPGAGMVGQIVTDERGDRLTHAEAVSLSTYPIRFSPDGKKICFSPGNKNFRLISRNGQDLQFFQQDNDLNVDQIRFSPDGRFVYFTSRAKITFPDMQELDRYTGEVRVLDMESLQCRSVWVNRESERILRTSKFESLEVGPGFLCCSSSDKCIRILDREYGTVVATQELEAICDTLSLAHDESCVVAGTRYGDLLVIDVPSGAIRQMIHAHDDIITAVTFAGPDLVISASHDRNLKLWKFHQGELSELLVFGPVSETIKELNASTDGRIVSVLVEDETAIRVLRVDTLREQLQEYGLDW